MFNQLLIFKQETVISKGDRYYCLEPIWANEMFSMCLKGGREYLWFKEILR